MKANEAPEKIYISYEGYGVFGEDGSTERTKISQIEYTRTDAFIEKACEWLEPVFKDFAGYYSGAELLDDFKKHMKGE